MSERVVDLRHRDRLPLGGGRRGRGGRDQRPARGPRGTVPVPARTLDGLAIALKGGRVGGPAYFSQVPAAAPPERGPGGLPDPAGGGRRGPVTELFQFAAISGILDVDEWVSRRSRTSNGCGRDGGITCLRRRASWQRRRREGAGRVPGGCREDIVKIVSDGHLGVSGGARNGRCAGTRIDCRQRTTAYSRQVDNNEQTLRNRR